jgi:hypothetical protein
MHCCVAGCLWGKVRSYPLPRHPCVASTSAPQASSPCEMASMTCRYVPCSQSRCHRCRDVTPRGGDARVPPRTPHFRRSEPMFESREGLWGSPGAPRPSVVVHEVDDEVAGRVGLLARRGGACPRVRGTTAPAGLSSTPRSPNMFGFRWLLRCRRNRWVAGPGAGPYQRRRHHVTRRADGAVAGHDHRREHRLVGVLRHGFARGDAGCGAGRVSIPPGPPGQRHAHRGPSTSDLREPRSAVPHHRPGLGRPALTDSYSATTRAR